MNRARDQAGKRARFQLLTWRENTDIMRLPLVFAPRYFLYTCGKLVQGMQLYIRLDRPGFADGKYAVHAKGYLLAALHWANERGPLPDWTALAYVPLDTDGRGCFHYAGGRAIPAGATHVAAELIAADFTRRERILQPLPELDEYVPIEGPCVRFALMSDLHLSSKPGRIRRALRRVRQADCVLMIGDLTNDGLPEQFDAMAQAIADELPDVPVLSVCGNHDFPVHPLPLVRQGVTDWYGMQHWLLERARDMGVPSEEAPCGAFAANVGGVPVYGLNAASHWRRFVFPEGRQLDWLEERLGADASDARVVLCHAPLLDHNIVRVRGNEPPYLSRDARLRGIVEGAGRVIFASGHTHSSMNETAGCVEASLGNIYIDDSCVAPTEFRSAETPAAREWVEGAVLHMTLAGNRMEIAAQCVTTGKWISRGCYRFGDGHGSEV